MSKEIRRDFLLHLLAEIDYDIYKNYIEETSEEPEEIEGNFRALERICNDYGLSEDIFKEK